MLRVGFCVLICGAVVLIKTVLIRIRKSKAEKKYAGTEE